MTVTLLQTNKKIDVVFVEEITLAARLSKETSLVAPRNKVSEEPHKGTRCFPGQLKHDPYEQSFLSCRLPKDPGNPQRSPAPAGPRVQGDTSHPG